MDAIDKLETSPNTNDDIERRFSTSARLFTLGSNDNNTDDCVRPSPFLPDGKQDISESSSKVSTSLQLSVLRQQQQAEQQSRLADQNMVTTSLAAVEQQQRQGSPNSETDNVGDTTDAQFLSIGWADVLLRKNIKDWRTLSSYRNFMSCHRGVFDAPDNNIESDGVVYLPTGIKLGGSGGNSGAAAAQNIEAFKVDEGYAERNYYTYKRLNEKQRLIYNAIVRMNESYDPNKGSDKDGDCLRGTAAESTTEAGNQNNSSGYDSSYMGDVVLIQAPPGTGKTHVLLTVAHQMMKNGDNLPYVIIFKHGLIFRYRYCTAGFSVAKFCMYAFGLRSLETFKGLERVVNRLDSVECIINNVLQLTRQFKPCDDSRKTPFEVRGNVLMFDEYTVITKILLLAVLFAGKLHNLKYVFCGDRNQLGCIRSSIHTHSTSSYDIISAFTDKVFNLDTYVRCGDDDYNSKISLIGRMVSDEQLGMRGNAIVAALFLPHMLRWIGRHDTIIMRNHRELSHTIYMETLKHQARNSKDYVCSFWILEKHLNEVHGHHMHDNCYIPNPVYRFLSAVKAAQELGTNASKEQRAAVQDALYRDVPGKHLPFLVLNVGGVYYYETMSDSSLCVLREIFFNQSTGEPERIYVDLVDENLQPHNMGKLLFRHTNCNNVVFSQHFNYLTNDGCDEKPGSGTLINFPIYPKFIMTTYMSQGCTISTRVSFNTIHCNYRCLYVMMSRVRTPDSINSVKVPNHFSHLISVLMNFDVTRYDNLVPVSEIEAKLVNGVYVMYRYWHEDMSKTRVLTDVILRILDTRIPRERRSAMLCTLRNHIVHSQIPRIYIHPIAATSYSDTNHNPVLYHNTMNFMLRYKIVMMGLVQLTQYEATIWLRAFLQRIEISSQFSHPLFSTRDEYSTTSLHFEHLFESNSNYKLLTGMNVEPISSENESGQNSGTKMAKAQRPSPVAMLFGQHVRRINMAYWQQHGSAVCCDNTNTVDNNKDCTARINDDVVGSVTGDISLGTSHSGMPGNGTTLEQQQKEALPCSSKAIKRAGNLLENYKSSTSAPKEPISSQGQQQDQSSVKKFRFPFARPKSSSSSVKGAKNIKRKGNDGCEVEDTTRGKRQKHDEYLAAKEAFSSCKTLTELLIARLNL